MNDFNKLVDRVTGRHVQVAFYQYVLIGLSFVVGCLLAGGCN